MNLDSNEIARYAALAEKWWRRNGEFKALHDINPARVRYILERVDIRKKPLLDVGCGGGLLAEALSAAGAKVTGIDMALPALNAARAHAGQSGLNIDYRQNTAENFAQTHRGRFAAITCMELLEHVPEPASVIAACAGLVRPGGHLFFATINRTLLARLLVIWAAEYVLGIVGRGTHTYKRFVRPEEMKRWGKAVGLQCEDVSGLRYLPFIGYAALCTSTAMNYLMHFMKPDED